MGGQNEQDKNNQNQKQEQNENSVNKSEQKQSSANSIWEINWFTGTVATISAYGAVEAQYRVYHNSWGRAMGRQIFQFTAATQNFEHLCQQTSSIFQNLPRNFKLNPASFQNNVGSVRGTLVQAMQTFQNIPSHQYLNAQYGRTYLTTKEAHQVIGDFWKMYRDLSHTQNLHAISQQTKQFANNFQNVQKVSQTALSKLNQLDPKLYAQYKDHFHKLKDVQSIMQTFREISSQYIKDVELYRKNSNFIRFISNARQSFPQMFEMFKKYPGDFTQMVQATYGGVKGMIGQVGQQSRLILGQVGNYAKGMFAQLRAIGPQLRAYWPHITATIAGIMEFGSMAWVGVQAFGSMVLGGLASVGAGVLALKAAVVVGVLTIAGYCISPSFRNWVNEKFAGMKKGFFQLLQNMSDQFKSLFASVDKEKQKKEMQKKLAIIEPDIDYYNVHTNALIKDKFSDESAEFSTRSKDLPRDVILKEDHEIKVATYQLGPLDTVFMGSKFDSHGSALWNEGKQNQVFVIHPDPVTQDYQIFCLEPTHNYVLIPYKQNAHQFVSTKRKENMSMTKASDVEFPVLFEMCMSKGNYLALQNTLGLTFDEVFANKNLLAKNAQLSGFQSLKSYQTTHLYKTPIDDDYLTPIADYNKNKMLQYLKDKDIILPEIPKLDASSKKQALKATKENVKKLQQQKDAFAYEFQKKVYEFDKMTKDEIIQLYLKQSQQNYYIPISRANAKAFGTLEKR